VNSGFLEVFQKPPGRHSKPPGGLCYFCGVFWVPEMELPGGTTLPARRRLVINPVSGFWLELPGGDEQPPGDANLFPSFLIFSRF